MFFLGDWVGYFGLSSPDCDELLSDRLTCCRRHCPPAFYAMTSSRCSFPPVSRRSARKHDPRTPSRSRSALHVRCRYAAGRRIRRCWCARPLSLKAEVSLGILRIAHRENRLPRESITLEKFSKKIPQLSSNLQFVKMQRSKCKFLMKTSNSLPTLNLRIGDFYAGRRSIHRSQFLLFLLRASAR